MISVAKAKEFARRHFPDAPEKLVQHLGVELRRSPMDGCDGWCLTVGKKTIIRLNSNLSSRRQRFTLAHELGHLILGVPSVVGESLDEMLHSNAKEEAEVNELASELLIPSEVVRSSLRELPIVAAALKKLARQANVSELAAAIRVCNLASEIGLVNASVVLFDGDKVRWQWSRTLKMPDNTAIELLENARTSAPGAFRKNSTDGDVVVASTIENPGYGTATLFVQLLPAKHGMKLSHHEKRRQLESRLFADDVKLQQRMSGFFGAHKNRIKGKTRQDAEQDFWVRYGDALSDTVVNSKVGREYVRLRVGEWY